MFKVTLISKDKHKLVYTSKKDNEYEAIESAMNFVRENDYDTYGYRLLHCEKIFKGKIK